jgi:hypothetical protein
MTRIFYDGIDASKLPAKGDGYLGYDDGNWPDAEAERERFPDAVIGIITTNPKDNKGSVGDGPPDNGSWPEWVSWVAMRRQSGEQYVTINTDYDLWQAGKTAFITGGVPEPQWWVSQYDGNAVIPDGAVAKQYASNGDYDTSIVADYWPGVDPAPTPVPVPVEEEEDMAYCYNVPVSADAGAERVIYKLEGGKYVHVPGGAEDPSYGSMVAAGIKTLVISYELHAAQLDAYGGVGVSA